ncbi:beta strand repeat-containing protein [Calothrix sp. NIES-2098]|uniref:beta strand repeat-containing protein n=1 Tax=Calothrix sp. NIES-2098 TaxID=1954171 RepID=UPI000B5E7451|nr:filamentous hemagglutinin-like protein [Calothrix sp. NIES-2098]
MSTDMRGQGDGGDLFIKATELVEVLGTEEPGTYSSMGADVSFGGIGNPGNLTIETKKLVIISSQVGTATNGKGNAGNVTVKASESVEIYGKISSTNSDPTKPLIINPAGLFAQVNTQGEGNGGNLKVETPSLSIGDGGKIQVAVFGKGDAGNLKIRAADIDIYDTPGKADFFQGGIFAGFQVDNDESTKPPQGDFGGIITIETDRLRVRNGGAVTVLTEGEGNAGRLQINAKDYIEVYGKVTTATTNSIFTSKISGEATKDSTGNGGTVILNTDKLIVRDSGNISASTSSIGKAGDILLNTNTLTVASGGEILAFTEGSGNGGTITVNAAKEINLGIGVQDFVPVLSVETSGAGKAGDIFVTTPILTLSDTARITATATATATNSSGGGSISLNASKMNLAGIVGVFAETQGESPAGTLRLQSDNNKSTLDLTLAPGSKISASTSGSANGGDLLVSAPQAINISGQGKLAVETTDTGNAGNIEISTQKLTLSDGVQISASTSSSGKAGNINLNVGENITITGSGTGLFASTSENSTGKGGSIIIDPRIMKIRDGATISTNSQGEGIGGDIKLTAGSLTLDNGKISAETRSSKGGNITLNVQDLLLLRNGSQISTTAGTAFAGGDGGNINFDGKFIVAIPNENSDISADAFAGNGGNIQINAQGIFGIESRAKPTDKSDITASSEQGISGAINLNQPDNSSLQNSFSQLSPNVIDTNALIANSCIARGSKKQENSFTITGSGALRNSPGDVLISTYSTGDVRNVEPTSQTWKKGDPIIEPQGLYRLSDGQLLLSRTCS